MEHTAHSPCLSCASCGVTACKGIAAGYPAFCPTAQAQEALLPEMLREAADPGVSKLTIASAQVEAQGYGRWCRVEDTIALAKKMGIKRLGIATCVGLLKDAKLLVRVLEAHGFAVYTVSCKVGAVPKTQLGIPAACTCCGVNSCNPILQAKVLNAQQTQLNIVFGLCVGHDTLFYRYSHALCTTLVAKDRVTGHNPIVPLYLLDSYYKKLLEQSELDLIEELRTE